MNKRLRFGIFFTSILLVFVFLFAETIVVKIKTASVRREPKFYAASLATVGAGTALTKITAKDGWFQVKTKTGVTGWVHSSAIDTKKFDLASMGGTQSSQASSGEIALAAKGFNKRIEDSYKAKNAAANYAGVDAMERLTVAPADVEAFLKQGRLGEFGGAR